MKSMIIALTTSLFVLFTSIADAGNAMVTLNSKHSVSHTADRLEVVLKAKGMTVFTRINHSEGAREVGKELRPTELVIFGNPKIGTPLMQCAQTIAIDLPQKALIWEDENGLVWLAYNDPSYLAERHAISGCEDVINKVVSALRQFATEATSAK